MEHQFSKTLYHLPSKILGKWLGFVGKSGEALVCDFREMELFQEHDDDDNEGEDIDMYKELNDDDEEDVDTNYSKGDEVDADDSNVDDGALSDVGLLFLLRLQLVVAELFQEHDDDDNEGKDIDMYEELNMSNLPAL
uniref:Uncharacterized protein n=1 Tax=Tanacetum cinerariifolium TaxID=118510 RepID=A0A699I7G3_TANCI|nr:hypothetical protein [Tanacetum cinerariifolium]